MTRRVTRRAAFGILSAALGSVVLTAGSRRAEATIRPLMTKVRIVESISEMRELRASKDRTMTLALGYETANDGGGGLFYWDKEDTTSPEDGGLIFTSAISTQTGRWKRVT